MIINFRIKPTEGPESLSKAQGKLLEDIWKKGKRLTPSEEQDLRVHGVVYREALSLNKNILVVKEDSEEVVYLKAS